MGLARHADSCRLNLAAQTALIRCFSQVGQSDQNGLNSKLMLLPEDRYSRQFRAGCAALFRQFSGLQADSEPGHDREISWNS